MQQEGEDVAQVSVERLERDIRLLHNLPRARPIMMTVEDKENHKNATICWLCEESQEDDKVRDHCHFTGKYRGAAHNTCNLKHRLPRFVPVYFHNLEGYDAHLFVRNLATTEGEIRCILNTEENYISFSKKIKVGEYEDKRTKRMKSISQDLRFVDSVINNEG